MSDSSRRFDTKTQLHVLERLQAGDTLEMLAQAFGVSSSGRMWHVVQEAKAAHPDVIVPKRGRRMVQPLARPFRTHLVPGAPWPYLETCA